MASSRRYFETDLPQSRLEHRGSRGEFTEGCRAARIAGYARVAYIASLRDRAGGLCRSGMVPELGGGSRNYALSDAVVDPRQLCGAGSRTQAHSMQGTADDRH